MIGTIIGDAVILKVIKRQGKILYQYRCRVCGACDVIDAEWIEQGLIVTHRCCSDGGKSLYRRINDIILKDNIRFRNCNSSGNPSMKEFRKVATPLIIKAINESGGFNEFIRMNKIDNSQPYSYDNIVWADSRYFQQLSNTKQIMESVPVKLCTEDYVIDFVNVGELYKYDIVDQKEFSKKLSILVTAYIRDKSINVYDNIMLQNNIIYFKIQKKIRLVGDLYVFGSKAMYGDLEVYKCKCRVCGKERFVLKYLMDSGLVLYHNECKSSKLDRYIHKKLRYTYSTKIGWGLMGSTFKDMMDFCQYVAKGFIETMNKYNTFKDVQIIRKNINLPYEKGNITFRVKGYGDNSRVKKVKLTQMSGNDKDKIMVLNSSDCTGYVVGSRNNFFNLLKECRENNNKPFIIKGRNGEEYKVEYAEFDKLKRSDTYDG